MAMLLPAVPSARRLTLAAVLAASAAAELPPLPALAVDSFPPAAREAIAPRYLDARAHPSDASRVGALAGVLHAWEMWDTAHEAYERAERLDPAAFEWAYLDGAVLQRLGRHGDAAAHLVRALEIRPGYLPARLKLAEARLEAGDLAGSRTIFEALVSDRAAAAAAELGLGRIAAAEGRHDEAVRHFERSIARFPALGAAHYALALAYRALGRRDEARPALEAHRRHGARWPPLDDPVLDAVLALKDDGRTWLRTGVKLADAGDVAGAIAAHEAALARDGSLADAHANLISLYGQAGDWAKAEEHYRAVVALGVDLADAHYDYGVLLGLQEKWAPAERAYRQAIEANPRHPQAHNNLGQLLERQGRFDEAAVAYRQAAASEPGFRLARFNLGRMLIALGRPDEAAAELEKIVEPRDGETPRYLFALATAHVQAGRRHEGVRRATEARRLALELGQQDLAAAIERDLARLP